MPSLEASIYGRKTVYLWRHISLPTTFKWKQQHANNITEQSRASGNNHLFQPVASIVTSNQSTKKASICSISQNRYSALVL